MKSNILSRIKNTDHSTAWNVIWKNWLCTKYIYKALFHILKKITKTVDPQVNFDFIMIHKTSFFCRISLLRSFRKVSFNSCRPTTQFAAEHFLSRAYTSFLVIHSCCGAVFYSLLVDGAWDAKFADIILRDMFCENWIKSPY